MANLMSVRLDKGGAPSWGFRLQGGKDFGTPLVVQKINGGSPAERAGLIAGDTVVKINNTDVYNLRHKDAQDVILRAGPSFEITIQRGGSTWKPSVTPVGSIPSPRAGGPYGSISPVTSTSLSSGKPVSIDAIGTSHNTFARPYSVQVNGGPKLVNKQYNSPLNLYSEHSIAETISAQSELLSNGVLGVNFKKNEKDYDAKNSEVYRMVQEADKEPRDYESEPEPAGSGVISAPLGIGGLRHVHAPENKPASPKPQLPPGQNICADCERLIVGVFVRIKDKNLHVECFKCSTCGSSLKNVGYYNINNKLYCDVHAKLAARNNPPAPNLTPITIPPGGKIPSGVPSIPSLPSPAPLSPSINYSAAPYQSANYSSPRPFSSVSAPLSPSSHFPKTSPTPPYSAPFVAPPSSAPFGDTRVQKNIVWPPAQTEPELPTASPLYFPPPSQVEPLLKERQQKDCEENVDDELEEMSYYAQQSSRNMSLCSTEISNITDRRSAVECTETISDTIGTQMLVESIMQTRSTKEVQSLPEKPTTSPPADVSVTFTISEADLKRGVYVDSTSKMSSSCETVQAGAIKTSLLKDSEQQSLASLKTDTVQAKTATASQHESLATMHETHLKTDAYVDSISKTSSSVDIRQAEETKTSKQLASIYEKNVKVENAVPQKWESSMVTALTTASDKPYQTLERDVFAQIPTKRSSSALASALSVAPAEPFTPVTTVLEPIPLPEFTVPYFPPERPVFEPKPSQEDKPARRKFNKPKEEDDPFFKDLPKPTEKISLRAALTTAPDRPFSPMNVEAASYDTERVQEDVLSSTVTKQASSASSLSKSVQLGTKSEKTHTHLAAVKSETKTNESQSLQTTRKSESLKASNVKSAEKTSSSESISKSVLSSEDVTKLSTCGTPPLIQCVRSTFATKTDKVQMELSCQFVADPITQQQIIKKSTTQTDHKEQKHKESSSEKHQAYHKLHRENESQIQAKSKTQEKKAVSEEKSFSESVLLQKATRSKEEQVKREVDQSSFQQSAVKKETHVAPQKEPVTIISPGERNVTIPTIAFQPVNEETPPSSTFSPRPRQLTPSMISKPPPVIPSYQANLVPVECRAAEANLFDPTSPATSRPPSPYVGRPSSPFPSSAGRAVSPAPGPPPNPLQPHKSAEELVRESRMEQAKSSIQQYIPQHQAKGRSTLQKRASLQQMHEMATITGENTESFQCQKKVFEEVEQQKSTLMKMEKSSTNIQTSTFHSTNPQLLKSPFLSGKSECIGDCPNKSIQPSVPKPTAPRSSGLAPSNVASSLSISKPNTSQPNIGSGGGRQAPAIGVAPRRGRGILNLSATPGSRVPLCGHCHSNIRYYVFSCSLAVCLPGVVSCRFIYNNFEDLLVILICFKQCMLLTLTLIKLNQRKPKTMEKRLHRLIIF